MVIQLKAETATPITLFLYAYKIVWKASGDKANQPYIRYAFQHGIPSN